MKKKPDRVRQGATPACPRCHGCLVPVEREETSEGRWRGPRCINCGNVIDAMILQRHGAIT